MWTAEHAIETTATPEAIWKIWADVPHWGEWNPDIERIEISGAFEAGSTITMTPRGQEAIELRLAEAVEPERFVDEADLGDVVVRTTHRIEPLDGDRSRVVYSMEISGPAADAVGRSSGRRSPPTFRTCSQHWSNARGAVEARRRHRLGPERARGRGEARAGGRARDGARGAGDDRRRLPDGELTLRASATTCARRCSRSRGARRRSGIWTSSGSTLRSPRRTRSTATR